jgi:hypothetical protein
VKKNNSQTDSCVYDKGNIINDTFKISKELNIKASNSFSINSQKNNKNNKNDGKNDDNNHDKNHNNDDVWNYLENMASTNDNTSKEAESHIRDIVFNMIITLTNDENDQQLNDCSKNNDSKAIIQASNIPVNSCSLANEKQDINAIEKVMKKSYSSHLPSDLLSSSTTKTKNVLGNEKQIESETQKCCNDVNPCNHVSSIAQSQMKLHNLDINNDYNSNSNNNNDNDNSSRDKTPSFNLSISSPTDSVTSCQSSFSSSFFNCGEHTVNNDNNIDNNEYKLLHTSTGISEAEGCMCPKSPELPSIEPKAFAKYPNLFEKSQCVFEDPTPSLPFDWVNSEIWRDNPYSLPVKSFKIPKQKK